jgi:hypothetical protein
VRAVQRAVSDPRPAPEPPTVGFDFHGVGLSIQADAPELREHVVRDFEYFASAAPPEPIVLRVHAASGPFERVPERRASMVTPNAVIYDEGNVRYADYQGRALAIYDFGREEGDVWSLDPDLLYEVVYLLALSRIGERHDLAGIHRVHALGAVVDDRAALVLLPEGGGKSTLAMALLQRPEIRLLSDDTPLVRGDRLLAFPTRIGVRASAVEGVPPDHVRTVRRREREAKTVIDYRHFRDRVVAEARPAAVIIGTRHGGARSWLEPVSRRAGLTALGVNLVFGLGLPQVVEFFLRGGAADLVRKGRIVGSRMAASARLVRQARCYRLLLGRDVEGAAAAIAGALRA